MSVVEASARDAGRDPADVGMEGRLNFTGDTEALVDLAEQWRAAGATHVAVNTMRAGFVGLAGHLEALTAAAGSLHLGRST